MSQSEIVSNRDRNVGSRRLHQIELAKDCNFSAINYRSTDYKSNDLQLNASKFYSNNIWCWESLNSCMILNPQSSIGVTLEFYNMQMLCHHLSSFIQANDVIVNFKDLLQNLLWQHIWTVGYKIKIWENAYKSLN